MRYPSRHVEQIDRARTEYLVGDVDSAALGVVCARSAHSCGYPLPASYTSLRNVLRVNILAVSVRKENGRRLPHRHTQAADASFWPIASSCCAAEFGRYLGIADIDQAARRLRPRRHPACIFPRWLCQAFLTVFIQAVRLLAGRLTSGRNPSVVAEETDS